MVALGVAALALAAAPVGAAPSQPSTGEVQVELVAGYDGVVTDAAVVPVRVGLTGERARTAELVVEFDTGARRFRVELAAGSTVEVALSVPMTSSLTAAVSAVGAGRALGTDSVVLDPEFDVTAVGVGPSLQQGDGPVRVSSAAGIQPALLVPFDGDDVARPGVLDAMSGVVLGAADLDRLDAAQQLALMNWVWAGGDLAIDSSPAEQLPLVDLPATGARTAVGAGWVRFTDGRAAAGSWSAVVEPAMYRGLSSDAAMGFGIGFGMGDEWEFLGLIDVDFLPSWIVAIAVIGTALVAGPGLWFALRTPRGRRWMWIASPGLSLLVAAALLSVGQGVFTRSSGMAVSELSSAPWGSNGVSAVGLRRSTDAELPPGAQVLFSSPEAEVTDSGSGSLVTVDLPANSFGALGAAGLTFDSGPSIEVSAIAAEDGTAEVSVTNRSTTTLRNVEVSGAGRARSFADVDPGQTETLPFELSADFPTFGPVFPSQRMGMPTLPLELMPMPPESRGLVKVTGELDSAPDVGAALGTTTAGGRTRLSAVVPVTSDVPRPAALRIDPVGVLPISVDQRASMGGGFMVEEFGGDGVPTTVVGAGPGGEPALRDNHVRLSAAAGRPAEPCAVHTMVAEVALWDGSDWVPAQRVGEPYLDDRILEPNQVQDWAMPAIGAGEVLYLRLSSMLTIQPAQVFDCMAR